MVVAISIVVTFFITLVVTAVITTSLYKYWYELKNKDADINKNVITKQKDSYGNDIKMDTNSVYETATTNIKMDNNPAYDDMTYYY